MAWMPLAVGVAALSATARVASTDRAFGNPLSRDVPESVHLTRAAETGRGREALAPWMIPRPGWRDILWRTYAQASEDRLLAVAGGVVFYALLALFPALTAVVSLYGLFADSATISDNLAVADLVVPQDAMEIIRAQVAYVAAKGNATLSMSFLLGLAFALWSANSGMKAIIDALNIVYEEPEKRGIIKLNLVSLAFTAIAIVVLIAALAFVVIVPLALAQIGLGPIAELLIELGRWPMLVIFVMVGLALIYRHGPSRRAAQWQWISVGSLVATFAWLVGSVLFSWYLSKFADYDATYGALGAVIGMMMWMWLSVVVILVGAELNSEIEHQTAQDSTVGAAKPIGDRGAAMADTVGEVP